ncbi:MAG TPA: hypothetical protein VFI80_11065 [Burkholderiales bacterium]|nr:hypothetical protein [Burkholderiales bacterium]
MSARKVGSWVLCSIAAGGLLPSLAQAEIGTFRAYAGVMPTRYSVSFDNGAPDAPPSTYKNKTAKSSYTAVTLGGTWIHPKGIYVDLSAQQSGSATHDLWSDVTNQSQKFTHDVYTLTAGYSHVFPSGMSASGFGGYTQANTTLAAPEPPLGFSKDTFDSKGIFIGVGGGIPALRGQFSGSIALASMSGTWKDDNGFNNSASYTTGFSLSGGYTYRISEALGVTVDLRHQQYKYDFGVYANNSPTYSVTEKITSAGVRLSYQF